MDFFERFLHLAPDGGTGVLEAAYAVVGALVVATVVFRRRLARFIGRRAPSQREPAER